MPRLLQSPSAGRRFASVAEGWTIQRSAAPKDVVAWYEHTLGVAPPTATGSLVDLDVMKSRLRFYRQLGVSAVEFGELVSCAPDVVELEHSGVGWENLSYLLSCGLSSFLLCNVVMKMPSVLSLSLEAHLKPRMAFYREELFLSENEMLKIFEECPEFLDRSVVKDIRLRVQYFRRMGLSLEELTKEVILQCPQILGGGFWEEMWPKLQFLRAAANTAHVRGVLCRFPNVVHLSMDDQLRPFAAYFLEELKMGRRLFGQMIETFPSILTSNIDREIRPKIAYLRQLQLDQLQLFNVVVRRPHILKRSIKDGVGKKIEEMREMGIPPDVIRTLLVKSPKYFS